MSPRPVRFRKVSDPPVISGMKPYGDHVPEGQRKKVFLQYEEYESIRLCDHEGLNQQQAALQMEVSRPTLTRIYSRARQKMAEAIVMGKQLIIEGGKVYFDSEWYNCQGCHCYFNHPQKHLPVGRCPLCGSDKVQAVENPADEKATGRRDNSTKE